MRAFSSPGAGPVFGHLLLAVLDLMAGVTALVWPAPTALVLVIVVGLWAFVSGCTEFFAAFASGETAGTARYSLSAGWCPSPSAPRCSPCRAGTVALALMFGLFALAYGIFQIGMGIQLRHTGQPLHSVLDHAA